MEWTILLMTKLILFITNRIRLTAHFIHESNPNSSNIARARTRIHSRHILSWLLMSSLQFNTTWLTTPIQYNGPRTESPIASTVLFLVVTYYARELGCVHDASSHYYARTTHPLRVVTRVMRGCVVRGLRVVSEPTERFPNWITNLHSALISS